MIKLVTDYQCSLPPETLELYDIRLVPTYVVFGKERLREGVDISTEQFFRRLEKARPTPTSLPPTIQEIRTLYETILKEHPDATILSIHLSGRMSKTVENAFKAARELDDPHVHVFDTTAIGATEGLMVRQAAVMAEAGVDIEDILDRLNHMRDTARLFFIIDTLEYLAEGGRIGRATQLVGTTFNLKPMLTIHQGEVSSYARFTGREKAIASLKSLVVEVTRDKKDVQIGVIHAMSPDEAQKLAEDIKQEVSPAVIFVSEVPPAIGVHAGPGVLGVGWYVPPQPDGTKKEAEQPPAASG